MRPSNKPGVAGVLDTKAECRVLLDWLTDPRSEGHPTIPGKDADIDELDSNIITRFFDDVMYELPYDQMFGHQEPKVVAMPRFDIRVDDVGFVVAAANRIREQNKQSLPERVYNHFTGRTKAARAIIKALAPTEVPTY